MMHVDQDELLSEAEPDTCTVCHDGHDIAIILVDDTGDNRVIRVLSPEQARVIADALIEAATDATRELQ